MLLSGVKGILAVNHACYDSADSLYGVTGLRHERRVVQLRLWRRRWLRDWLGQFRACHLQHALSPGNMVRRALVAELPKRLVIRPRHHNFKSLLPIHVFTP
jgi:hypothetical protein